MSCPKLVVSHTNGTDATLAAKEDCWVVRGTSWTVPCATEAEAVAFLAGSGFREYDASDARAALKALWRVWR